MEEAVLISLELSEASVEVIFDHCSTDLNSGPNIKKYIGLSTNYSFKKDLLEEQNEAIRELLSQLPTEFRASGGKGWSFLALHKAIDDSDWTSDHTIMEKLLSLGIASGNLIYIMPKVMWKMLPGAMPYFYIKNM